MPEHTHTPPPEHAAPQGDSPATPPVIIQTPGDTERKMSGRSFVLGFLTAVLIGAIGAVAFLAVSDRDDDGNIQLDVPAVDVDVDG